MIGSKNQDCSFVGHSESQFIYFLNLKLLVADSHVFAPPCTLAGKSHKIFVY
jgi:hypothetical protein